ncbi:MAG: helix-turn-helix domain-containing protein [Anaerolineaceae bacterium]
MTDLTEDKGTKAIIRALDVKILEDHPQGLMLIDIANKLGSPKSTAHRILQTLVTSQIVKESPIIDGFYQLEIGTLGLSRSFLDGFDFVQEAQSFLKEIHD